MTLTAMFTRCCHIVLQQELLRYLSLTGINDTWARNPAWWHRLSELYTEITAGRPFAPIGEANPGQHHIGWIWTFTLNDGRSFEMHRTSSFGDGEGWMPIRSDAGGAAAKTNSWYIGAALTDFWNTVGTVRPPQETVLEQAASMKNNT